jgi:DNA-directed RNA polymerase specialized sigma24 family protein
MAQKLYQNEAWLKKRYYMDKKTPQEIAKECGVSDKTIYSHLDRFGLRKK